jgi:hypothetical protein
MGTSVMKSHLATQHFSAAQSSVTASAAHLRIAVDGTYRGQS